MTGTLVAAFLKNPFATQLHLAILYSIYLDRNAAVAGICSLSARQLPAVWLVRIAKDYTMSAKEKIRHIAAELKGHAPFTMLGALTGIAVMLIFKISGSPYARTLFSIFHPGHVLLSAMVTASIFQLHRKAKNFILVLIIGYVGSIGIATLSDSVVPYLGERLLGLHIPSHAHSAHELDENPEDSDDHNPALRIGFIEDWYIVNPAAIIGILIACFMPRTKLPHAVHVLISTWASSSHILMNTQGEITVGVGAGILGILFVAVWLPCCISDIIFPLSFVNSDLKLTGPCPCHTRHSHPHSHEDSEDNK